MFFAFKFAGTEYLFYLFNCHEGTVYAMEMLKEELGKIL